jgi:hypothetical protein
MLSQYHEQMADRPGEQRHRARAADRHHTVQNLV